MHPQTRHRLRPTLDSLEARDVPANLWLSSAWAAYAAPAPQPVAYASAGVTSALSLTGQTVNDRIVSYLASHLGQRVGGGECAHLAVEALRASGARFGWLTSTTLDYAWGTLLTRVTGYATGAVYGVPTATFRPGDVIQYTNAHFRDGTWATHHTAIVAAVDGNGRVTAVYQQNFNGVRGVTQQSLDLSQLVSGYVKVYRPLARTAVAGRYQFTVVNNTGGSAGVVERAGVSSSYTLTGANTAGSYGIRTWTTYGGVRPTIVVAGHAIAATDGAAYEVYNTGSGVGIRQIG
jgi:hypothetical protein